MSEFVERTLDLEAVRLELNTGEVVELKDALSELNIYVNLFSEGMVASLLFIDTTNITDNGPILGGEKLFVRWKSPIHSEWNEVLFRVRMVTERVPGNSQAMVVRLDLMSDGYMQAFSVALSRGFKTTYSDGVRKLWQNADITKDLKVDESLGIYTFAFPQTKNIVKNAEWAANRAKGPTGVPFVFFEDVDYFNFASWDRILKQTESTKLFHQPQMTTETPEKTFRNVMGLQFNDKSRDVSMFADMGLGNRIEHVFNPLTKSTQINERSFSEFTSSVSSLDKGKLETSLDTNRRSKLLLVKSDNSQSTSFFRDSLNYAMSSNSINIVTVGDSMMRLGTVVELNSISPQAQNMQGVVNQKFLGGKFLVSGLKHTIRKNDYRLYWKLVKESYLTEVKQNG